MLKKFSVTNFKGFKERLTLDLSEPLNYEFNKDLIQNGCVSKGILYGINGSGKSNLGLALFDIILNLTDKEKTFNKYQPYINLDSKINFASFEYTFEFDGIEVNYSYKKVAPAVLKEEKLIIDNKDVLEYDFEHNQGYSNLVGTEHINLVSNSMAMGQTISRVKFLRNTALLDHNDKINKAFISFTDFVDRMLMFYSLDERGYQGLSVGPDSFTQGIIRKGKTKDFEKLLHEQGVNLNLIEKDISGQKELFCHFASGDIPFFTIASTGTRSLALFYYWYLAMNEASFVYIDEYDAFYHFELSESLVKMLTKITGTQIIISTHNTDLLSNEILRPDCYFLLQDNNIRSLNKLTEKDIRKAHNLQKMYKAGSFNV